MDKRMAGFFLCVAALLAPAGASAATTAGDGFATRVVPDGDNAAPANRASRARAGDDVYYWVQWHDPPQPRSLLRCEVKDGAGNVVVDESESARGALPQSYSMCGYDTGVRGFEPGTFRFAIYLDGEKVSERTIAIESDSLFGRMTMMKQAKYAIGGLAVLFLAVYWVRNKLAGDQEAAAEVFAPAEEVKARRSPVIIGARIQAEAAAHGSGGFERIAQPAADQPDKLEVFRKSLTVDPAFRPSRAEDVLPIAKAARAAGDSRTAVAALRGFDKAHPGHELIPDVYFFSAKVMAEDLKNTAMARKVLEHLVQKYPGHYLAQEAKRYLTSLSPS